MSKKFYDIIPPKEITLPQEKKEIKPKRIFLKTLISCFIFIILLGVTSFYIFSKVEIEIWPEKDTLNLKEIITIDSQINQSNFEAKIIPGKIFSDEKSASEEFPATGKILKEEKTRGLIRVYNNYNLPQTLVAGTRFQPPLERFQPALEEGESPWFRTIARIVIPSKSYQDVKVIADSSGEKYNIDPSKFSIPGLKGLAQYTFVYGESFQKFEGGFNKEVSQVLPEDLKGAENSLVEKLKKESKEFLKKTLPSDFVLLDNAILQEIQESNSSLDAGIETESFNFQVKIHSDVLAFRKSDIENFAKNLINLNISEGKKFQEESLEIIYSLLNLPSTISQGKMVLGLEIKAKIFRDVDLTELKKALVGKSYKEIKLFLENLPELTKSEIKSWPILRKKIPEDVKKIEVRLILDPVVEI